MGFRVVEPEGGNGGPEDIHRQGILGEPLHRPHDRLGQRPGPHEVPAQLGQLGPSGEVPAPEEVDDLLEGGVLGEVVDVVPLVEHPPLDPIDEADAALGRDDPLKPFADVRRVARWVLHE